MSEVSTVTSNEYRDQRLANMQKLSELGYAPFGAAFGRTGTLAALRAEFAEEKAVTAHWKS